MNFEAFSSEDVQQILDHTLECMSKDSLEKQVQKFGSLEKYREYLASGFANEQAIADILKYYGGKDKAMNAIMESTGDTEEQKQSQEKNTEIYRQFMTARETDNADLADLAVKQLAENYKEMFRLDNARNILLDLAKEYLQYPKLAEATDSQYGEGCSQYVAHAILRYYGA